MTVFFHGNFGLDRSRMAKLLDLGLGNPDLKDTDLARPFGYGAPFAAIYRSWLHKTGLAERGRPISLTSFGEVILANDKLLDDQKTMLFLHQSLTEDPQRAEAWHFFFGSFRTSNHVFSTTDLRHGLMDQLSSHSEQHFGEGSSMIPIIARKLIECYTSEKALGPIKLVKKLEQDRFEFVTEANTELPRVSRRA